MINTNFIEELSISCIQWAERVDEETMKFLDIYEGVDSGLYKCEKIELASVSAGDYFTGRHEIYSYFYYGNMKNFRKIQKWTCI